MNTEYMVLIVALCVLFLCVGAIIGMVIDAKISKEYITEFFSIEKDLFNNVDNIMTEYIKKSEVIHLKYYIIEDTTPCLAYNEIMLVKANNKKEALEIMWKALGYDHQENDIKKGYEPHYKKEFEVTELEQYFTEYDIGDNCVILR